ncbi:MAG: helix-turn-helix domain-containing protein [Candidatus Thorarchaeota archaeon]|jgi:predicted DNA binding protein
MPLFEVVFRVKYDNPLSEITKDRPSVKIFQWCNDQHDIMELIMPKKEDYGQIRDDMAKAVEIVDEIHNGANTHVITQMCSCGGPGTVQNYLGDPSLLLIPPIAYENGWEHLRLIAFRHENVKKLLERLRNDGFDVEIIRKKPFDGYIASSLTLTTDALFSGLTEKQVHALLTAFAQGYFRFPRGSDLQTIASKEKISRTTFLEHLKKAENKIITALIPHIQLFRQIPQDRKDTMSLVSEAS